MKQSSTDTTCPQCGAQLAASVRFCGSCGHAKTIAEPEPPVGTASDQPTIDPAAPRKMPVTPLGTDDESRSDTKETRSRRSKPRNPYNIAILVVGVLVVALVAVAVVVVVGNRSGDTRKSSIPVDPDSTAVAKQLDMIVGAASVNYKTLTKAKARFASCAIPAGIASGVVKEVLKHRQAMENQLDNLFRHERTELQPIISALRVAVDDSMTAEREWQLWIQGNSGTDKKPCARTDVGQHREQGDSDLKTAATAKQAFVDVWNPFAREFPNDLKLRTHVKKSDF